MLNKFRNEIKHQVEVNGFWLIVVLSVIAVMGLIAFVSCDSAAAQTYVRSNDGSILYQKYAVSVPYYYCGRKYYRSEWRYKQVVDYRSKDWRQQMLDLIDKQKERQSFQEALNHIGAQGIMGGSTVYPQQRQYVTNYPSAAGKTHGGFSKVEYSRYGYSNYDLNKASEKAQAGVDAFLRLSADQKSRAEQTFTYAGQLQQLNVERVGAIAEAQENRAMINEMGQTITRMTQAQAELFRSLPRPKSSESFSYESESRSESRTEGGSSPPPPPGPGAVDGLSEAQAGLIQKYCSACHGAGKQTPDGDFYFDPNVPLSEALFGSVALRLDPDAPAKRQDGSPYRMPPEGSEQPTLEERRALVDAAKILSQMGG